MKITRVAITGTTWEAFEPRVVGDEVLLPEDLDRCVHAVIVLDEGSLLVTCAIFVPRADSRSQWYCLVQGDTSWTSLGQPPWPDEVLYRIRTTIDAEGGDWWEAKPCREVPLVPELAYSDPAWEILETIRDLTG